VGPSDAATKKIVLKRIHLVALRSRLQNKAPGHSCQVPWTATEPGDPEHRIPQLQRQLRAVHANFASTRDANSVRKLPAAPDDSISTTPIRTDPTGTFLIALPSTNTW